MKYCTECGQKVEGANGMPPKFCSNCAHPLGGVAKATAKPSSVDDDVILPSNIPSLELEVGSLSDPDSPSFKAESIMGTQAKASRLNRGAGETLDSYKSRMQSRTPIDAD